MIKRLRTNPLATAIVLASVATPLHSFGAVLEEIVVTAQKRAQDMQDVPIAVTAMSADMIKKAGITGVEGIAARTPGFSMGEFNPTQPQLYIRGIGSNGDGAASGEQSVAMFIDGVYVNRSAGSATELYDIQSIEVLRGPQGTLWGKNAIAGAINITTKRPSEEFEAGLELNAGNYGLKNYRGMISGGLTDTLAGKVSFNEKQRDGYIESVIDSNFEQGDLDSSSLRGQLLWTPTDSLEALLTVNYGTDRRSGAASLSAESMEPDLAIIGATLAAAHADGLPYADFYENYSSNEGYTEMDSQGASLQIDWDLPWATLTSLTAYQESKSAFYNVGMGGIDADIFKEYGPMSVGQLGLFAGLGFTSYADENSRLISQELRLSGDTDKLNWQAGVYYNQESVHRGEGTLIDAPSFLINVVGPVQALAYNPANDLADQYNDTTSTAIFGQATYSITDKLDLTLGLRYTEETKEYTNIGTLIATENPALPPVSSDLTTGSQEKTWRSPTYKIVANYHIGDSTMVYASAATGFKSGGFNYASALGSALDEAFNEENALNMEIGFKSMLMDDRLRLNGAIFKTDYEDLQVLQQFDCGGCAIPPLVTKNAGKAVSEGIELEATFALTDSLQLAGTYAYLDTEYVELEGNLKQDEGNALRNAPRNAYTLVTSYEKEMPFGGFMDARLEYIHKEKAYQDTANYESAAIPEYRVFNTRLAYTSADEKWEIAGWVNNLTGEEYYSHNYQAPPFGFIHVPAMPRTYGVTVTWTNF
ncbi:TonB-dependent receptor [Aestuariicella sp. G3-2]|uniref:TonB-dependent receptor n=1 Tax=Pseudomaricurvus albidus TaxID=2842452 RepID=UPI001C0CFBD2|nr:TonB-dependent receptor [Aestuariicella albida]MBU3071416.1 TonB-dependent receptor [Aestuariicella albida]